MLAGAQAVQIGVAQDAKQPRARPGRLAELVELLLGLAKPLPGQILRVRGGAGQSVRKTIERHVMLVEQFLDAPLTAGKIHGLSSPIIPEPGSGRFIPASRKNLGKIASPGTNAARGSGS